MFGTTRVPDMPAHHDVQKMYRRSVAAVPYQSPDFEKIVKRKKRLKWDAKKCISLVAKQKSTYCIIAWSKSENTFFTKCILQANYAIYATIYRFLFGTSNISYFSEKSKKKKRLKRDAEKCRSRLLRNKIYHGLTHQSKIENALFQSVFFDGWK